MPRALDILLIFDYAGQPPADRSYEMALATEDYDGEAQVREALEEMGHRVRLLALYDDVAPLVEELKTLSLAFRFKGLSI